MSEASNHKTELTDSGLGLLQSLPDFGMKIDTGEMSRKLSGVACLEGEFQAGLRWVFACWGAGVVLSQPCPLWRRLVRDARMHRMESTSEEAPDLKKAVPRRPAWEEDQEGCGAVMCGAKKAKRAGPALPSHRVPLGVQSLCCEGGRPGRMAPARHTRGQGLGAARGSRPVGPGRRRRCGARPAACPSRHLCEWGCSRFQEGSAVPAPATMPWKERTGLCGGQPLFSLTPGPGQRGWLAEGWTCSLRQRRLASAWSPDPDSVPFSFSLCKIVPQDSWNLLFPQI